MPESVRVALELLRAEPRHWRAIFHDFTQAFRRETDAKYPPRPRAACRPCYGDTPDFGATDVARLAKGVAQATARLVAEEVVAQALAVAFEDVPEDDANAE